MRHASHPTPIRSTRPRVLFLLLLFPVVLPAESVTQRFSAEKGDPENSYDAPIPGFTGPEGDGVVPADTDAEDSNRVNPLFTSWADAVEEYAPAPGVNPTRGFSGEALGPVTGIRSNVVSLGDLDDAEIDAGAEPGQLTLKFSRPIRDFSGADFAVFENAFPADSDTGGAGSSGVFAELAYVEVSTDGDTYARFPAISDTPEAVGGFGTIDPRSVFNLAGKHQNALGQSWGTPFDLADLVETEEVINGTVDLGEIRFIRIVDVPGDGSFSDSRGNPIYDAWPTSGSGGADIEAVGAINQDVGYADWTGGADLPKHADANGDGWTNFQKFAFGFEPGTRVPPDVVRLEPLADNGFRFRFPRDQRNSGVRYVVERSEDGTRSEGWEPIAAFEPSGERNIDGTRVDSVTIESRSDRANQQTAQTVSLRLSPESGAGPSAFFRLRLDEIE